MINEKKTEMCPRCGQIETWSHVIQCPAISNEKNVFCKKLVEEIKKIGEHKQVEDSAIEMVKQIKEFLN